METDMLHAAASALLIILDPTRMLYLFGGVCMGLSLGILPGIGGIAGTALLLPFTTISIRRRLSRCCSGSARPRPRPIRSPPFCSALRATPRRRQRRSMATR